jgi:membrane protein DedA with SNARE-associated domain
VNDLLLEWLAAYGLSAYFGILLISSAGVPFPITLMLIVVGSFVEQGEMELWQVILLGSAAAVLGDQIGYCIGRFGGRSLIGRITNRFGGAENIKRAEKFTNRWGGAGIFFSRWLVTPLGPWLNLTSGVAGYPWTRFVFWDILGESLWVILYVMLGKIFSDRVQDISDIMGNLTWVFVGLTAAAILGWKLFRYFQNSEKA